MIWDTVRLHRESDQDPGTAQVRSIVKVARTRDIVRSSPFPEATRVG